MIVTTRIGAEIGNIILKNILKKPAPSILAAFTISSEINYDNGKLKKELNFKTKYSLKDKII